MKICEIFFETLNSPALCVKPQSVMALYGSGYTTGLSVDLGQDNTAINPIYEGGSITYANMLTSVAGAEVNNYIKESLNKRGMDFGKQTDNIISGILKHCVYIPEMGAARPGCDKKYKLPSGEVIDVSEEAYMAGEMYFKPDLVIGKSAKYLSLPEALLTSVVKCDPELQIEMYKTVVTHGGLAVIPGLNYRLCQEMETVLQRRVNVVDTTENSAVAWLGGAVFAGMKDAIRVWVSKKQFEDYGERIIRSRF